MTVAPTPLHGQAPHRRWLLAAGAVALVEKGSPIDGLAGAIRAAAA